MRRVLEAFPTHYPRHILEQAAIAGAFVPGVVDQDLQGTADRVAPPKDTHLLVEKLHEQKGITVTHTEIEGAGHFFEDPHMEQMIGTVDGYVRRRLTETTR